MRLSITTPRGAVVEIEADEVTAPGALGEFGVLAGHVPFLTTLRPGVLVYQSKGGTHALAVGEGILQVARAGQGAASGDKVLVLVGQAAQSKDIDRESAARELASLDAELGAWKKETGGEHKALLAKRAWASARVEAAARVAPH